ncbi:hypothetical protein AGMMS5026_05480 [Endomicrobiia bacterium]|uniref:Uncharacterized protein n=1 Tax=Endomicrobium trichonymphae TaxID=1408204 RepID=B1H0M2_ENDTX|nr:hypothetical protein [Candidatus Endomicrobium trichonymphae]GHT06679.1 hypothetical protein AGMMS49523_08980 [Endomicrobiia bacterium]BAG14054.1 hypothetical protein TGRD_561 [Candidatus Endomicrobium trichonymphae]GHT14084.1 hypothetical protein AGMMS49571_09040 [Endomicrobiia bacterium]GHT21562.1 hypothetical protein AGMMS49929_10260 [Endomicrobiia bacterium]GHT27929.1 hypothetical protein AGMMS49995_07840 [Endomicrobiia bacterium]
MRKIKNFRINLRIKEILGIIKKLVNVVELSIEVEEAVRRCCRFYSRFLVPSAVYETFSKEMLPFVFEKDVPSKWIAESVFFVTIGGDLYEEYKKDEGTFGEHTGKIISAVAVDALEQSKNFIRRLISSEAQEENCEISRNVDIPPLLYETTTGCIPADKIGISVEDGKLNPRYSECGLFYWIPSKKKTKK